jgi:hypothetical protein
MNEDFVLEEKEIYFPKWRMKQIKYRYRPLFSVNPRKK